MKQMNFSRSCPICGNLIWYTRKDDYRRALKKNTKCAKCAAINNTGCFKKGDRPFDRHLNESTIPKFNLDKLLDENLISLYWLGFILADGSFYNYKFELGLNENDKSHLIKFANYIGYDTNKIIRKENTNSNSILFSNRFSIPMVMKKWDIHYQKTYNPCDFTYFNHLSNEQLLSLLCGIIDGDGHIDANSGSTSIISHINWESFYDNLFSRFPYKISKRIRQNIICYNLLKDWRIVLQQYMQNHNLPLLNRKWNRLK